MEERRNHIDRIAEQYEAYGRDFDAFKHLLLKDKKQLSFISALEAELGVELFGLAQEAKYP